MELILYHYQDLIYYVLFYLLLVRVFFNYFLYEKIQSKELDGYWAMRLQLYYLALTFWWPKEFMEKKKIRKLKVLANILNVIFITLGLISIVVFLYLQEVNIKYRYIDKDWYYIFK